MVRKSKGKIAVYAFGSVVYYFGFIYFSIDATTDDISRTLPQSERAVLAIGEIIQTLLHNVNNKGGEKQENLAKLKARICSKYGLESSPRLTDIIAAVPIEHRKVLLPKLRAKPVRTASGVMTVFTTVF